ncbi:MAG: S8 family serine peptidase, partial [Cyanobacteriota bacterium]|nr:S8 family serine peptidase [Cyanobacteriota bacterium]
PGDGAGNSLESARDIGTLSGSQSFSDWVGKSDRDDFYRFEITEASQFSATLEGLSADADLQLLSSSGTVLASSTNGRSAAETITSSLDAGTYYARVYRYRGNTDYDLTVAATAAPPSGPTFRSTDGYGEASVERAIERLLDVSLADLSDRFSGGLYGLDRLGAPEVWNYGFTGEGMVVAVLDTGVDRNHADLDGNIWTNNLEIAGNGVDDDGNGFVDDVYGWNFAGNNNNTLDVNGHGTHVAGSIAAESNGFGVTGVAYNATIMPVKVLGDSGSGTYQGVAYGIRYAADNGADVINLSLGGGSGDSNVRNAIEYAWGLGVAVVMAAGNEGAASTGYPAAYASDWGIAVGAINNAGELASFSNRAGSTVLDYVTAAGVSVTSTTPGNSYATWSGTSMATPQVAGAMALLIEANRASGRNLSIAELEWLLMSTASNSSSATQLSGAGSTLLTGPSFQQAGPSFQQAGPGASLPPAASSSESPATPAPEGASDLGDAASPVGSAEAVAGNAVTAELLSPALITWMGTPLSSDDWMITAMERSRSGADDGLDLLTGLRSRSRVAA